jgi:hypothetical protein
MLMRSDIRSERVKIGLQEVTGVGMDCIDLVQGMDRWRALVNAVTNLRVPVNEGNYFDNCGPVRFSGRSLLHGVGRLVGIILSNNRKADGRKRYTCRRKLIPCRNVLISKHYVTL